MTSLICKTIYTRDRGVCIYDSDFPKVIIENKDGSEEKAYKIPEFDNLIIDEISYKMFKSSKNRFFTAVSIPGTRIKSLKPLSKNEYKDFLKTRDEGKFIPPKNLGEGSYGKVETFDIQKSIVKTSKKQGISPDIIKEIAVYRLFNEIQCIPKLQGFTLSPVIKLQIEKGVTTLFDVLLDIYDGNSLPINMEDASKIMLRLAKCLKVVSSQGIIHLDLKPENMIFTSSNQIQIIDWGLCEIPYNSMLNTRQGNNKQTLWWRAPEITIANQEYNFKADIFSLGLIFIQLYQSNASVITRTRYVNDALYMFKLLQLFLGEKIYKDGNVLVLENKEDIRDRMKSIVEGPSTKEKIKDQMNSYENELFQKDGFKFNEDFIDLVSGMLDFNPTTRIDYDEIILHPYFQNIKRESIPYLKKYINNMPNISGSLIGNRHEYLHFINTTCNMHLFKNKTLFLSIQLLDLLYSKNPRIKNYMKEYAYECVVLASKLFEHDYLEKSDLIYTKEIIEILDGNLLIPTLSSYYEPAKPENRNKIIGYYGRKDVYSRPFDKIDFDKMKFIFIANSIGLTVYKDEFKLYKDPLGGNNDFYVSQDVAIHLDEFEMAMNGESMIYTTDKFRGVYVLSLEAPLEGKLPSLR